MGILARGIRRFLNLVRTDGLLAAIRRLLRKPFRVLLRPAMQESAQVGADLEKTVATLGRTEARVAVLEDAQLATRLAVLEDAQLTRLAALEVHVGHQDVAIRELAARAAQLEADRARLDHAVAILELHGRSIVALADLKAASTPTPSPPPGSALISVVIPTRNRVDDLRHALASLQAQSWPGWEALVVDDASTDGTAEMLTALAAVDARIRWFAQPQQGHAAARNLALTHSRGDVVTYLDDDNEYFPDYLAAVAQTFGRDPSLEFAYAAQVWVGPGAVSRVTFDRYDWTELRDMRMSIDTNVMAHRRSLFERLGGFDADLLRHADLDLALRYTAATTPRRLPVMAVRYRWDATPRVSNTMSSAAALHRIRE